MDNLCKRLNYLSNQTLMKILIGLFIVIHLGGYSQTTYQYDKNGNRTARIIDLGKDLKTK